MKKRIAMLLAVSMALSMAGCAAPTTETGTGSGGTSSGEAVSGEMTFLNTPREETLIIEADAGQYKNPGWFNPYVDGADKSFGIQQFCISYLWEMNPMTGEWYCGLASELPVANEDYTEWTVKMREGLKWSDGEDVTADDVVFTMNMILNNEDMSANAAIAPYISGIEKISDYEFKITCPETYVRIKELLGVQSWGNNFHVMPEHIWSELEDPLSYQMDAGFVCAGPYTMDSRDELGNWALFVRRDDWENTEVGQLFGEPAPKYIICQYIGDSETRTMAAINNEVDCMVEVSLEMFEIISEQNENWHSWYDTFPYAVLDDTSAKGIAFNFTKEPFNNYYFRWGLALAINLPEATMSIFDGVGRSNPLNINATSLIQESYFIPMIPWLEELTIEGTDYHPFDSTYAQTMYEKLTAAGYELPNDQETLTNMFGVGWWKYDPEMATWCLEQAGLELRDGTWYYEGEPFSFTVTCCTEASGMQASRTGQAAADQWKKFGLNCEVKFTENQLTEYQMGEFDVIAQWECNGLDVDLYPKIMKWHSSYATAPVGTTTPNNGSRYVNERVDEIIEQTSQLEGDSEEAHELYVEYLQITTSELLYLPFFSGIKIVPSNDTYWQGFPTSENAYNAPYCWWSCFKFVLPFIESTVS